MYNTLLIIPLIAPIVAAVICVVIPKLKEFVSLISAILCIFASVKIIGLKSSWFYIDVFSSLVLILIQSIYFLSVLYSIYYVRAIGHELFLRRRYHYALINLFAMSMSFSTMCRNLGLVWVGLEATTIVSALLIVLEKNKTSIEAAWRYIIIASSGLGISLFSIILFNKIFNTLDWVNALSYSVNSKAAIIVAALALVGFGTKVGLFPVHTWLPDAHGTAPPSVSAMLSSTLLPVALLAYYKVFAPTVVNCVNIAYLTCFFGAMTVLVAAILTVPQKMIKRLFAYSSMDVMGIATVGIGLSYFTPVALKAVLLLLLIHAFSKSSLFFASGNVITYLRTHEISKITGLIETSKITGLSMILSSLAVTGAPPFASFIAELIIIAASLRFPVLTAVLVTAILISFLSINYHVTKMCFGKGEKVKTSILAEFVPAISCVVYIAVSVLILLYLEGLI